MSARHFNYYEDDWKTAILECPKGHWKGTIEEAGPRYFAEVMDCECPECDFFEAPILAIVNYSVGDGTDQRPRILSQGRTPSPRKEGQKCDLALQNFEDLGGAFRYRSRKEGELVELGLYYQPGKFNHFTRQTDPQGIWLGVKPIKVQDGIVSHVFTGPPEVRGLRFLVVETEHENPKALEAVAEEFDDVVPNIAELWKTNNHEAIEMVVARIGDFEHKQVQSQSLPPYQDARFEVLRAQAETNWREENPRLVKRLEARGKLDSCLDARAEAAVIILQQAERAGVAENQAEEAVAEVLFPPSEPDELDRELEESD